MSRDTLKITIEYRGPTEGSIENWSGPGWYISAPDPEKEGHLWLLEPRKVDSDWVKHLGNIIDGKLHTHVMESAVLRQIDQAHRQLKERVTRLEAVEASLANARRELEEYERATQ